MSRKTFFLLPLAAVMIFAGCSQSTETALPNSSPQVNTSAPVGVPPNPLSPSSSSSPSAAATTFSFPVDENPIVDNDGFVWHRYTQEPGLQFEYMDKFTGEKLLPVRMANLLDPKTAKISFMEVTKNGSLQDDGQTLEVFNKLENTTIEQAIADIITKNGKKASDCKVEMVKDNPLQYSQKEYPPMYRIYSAQPTVYTDDQIEEIALRKKNYIAEQDGPEDAPYLKKAFADQNLVSLCTTYAEEAGLGTSKSFPGYFLYNAAVNKTTFVYVPPQYDPLVYRNITFRQD